MPNRIDQHLAAATERKAGALLPYLTAGYPDLESTAELLRRLDTLNIAAVELGIPFSDPIADGPVIQTSFTRALRQGLKVKQVFDMVSSVRSDVSIPLLAMVSFSIVYRVGVDAFVRHLSDAGFDGLITPDLALEEAPGVAEAVNRAGLRHVMMVAPTSEPARREKIAKLSSGFVYYQAVVGITGERSELPDDLADNVRRLRAVSGCPIAVGFGISTPDHVRQVCNVADGAIVGSAIVRRINTAVDDKKSSGDIVKHVVAFVEELQAGTR